MFCFMEINKQIIFLVALMKSASILPDCDIPGIT